MRLILITGPMRSGTSLAAEMLHFLGAPAGVMQMMPQHPTWQSEWEDCELTTKLLELFPLADPKPTAAKKEEFRQFFAPYLHGRARFIQHMDRVWKQRTLTFSTKSPFLALVHDDVAACCEAFRLELRTVVCKRGEDAISGSIDRAFPKDLKAGAKRLNKVIASHLASIKADVEIDYDAALSNPVLAAQRLQALVGGQPYRNRLDMAASKVRTCPQHT